jgi:hypothetical protein
MRTLVKIAVGAALLASGAAAYADVATPSSGNGELVLFVRDTANAGRVYARGLGYTLNDVLSQAAITGDPTKVDSSNNVADTDTMTFSLPVGGIAADANLSTFLGGDPSHYVWTIMAGDNQGGQTGEGNRRYVTTAQIDYATQASTLTNIQIGTGAFNNLETMLVALNGSLPDGSGTSTPAGADGEWGQSGTSFDGAPSWFGAGPNNENAIGSAAHFYVLTTGNGGSQQSLARVYKGVDFTLGLNGTLTSASVETPQVPLPAAVWLLGSALAGFAGLSRRRKVEAA